MGDGHMGGLGVMIGFLVGQEIPILLCMLGWTR